MMNESPDAKTLTERAIDALAGSPGGVNLPRLARNLMIDPATLRAEMKDLESHGYVYRTGCTRGTRWHLN